MTGWRSIARLPVPMLASASILAGCGPGPDAAVVANRTAARESERLAEDALLATRVQVAEQRITQLERRVAELAAAPAAVEVDLLRQRLAGTEAELADASAPPEPAPTPTPRATPRAAPAQQAATPPPQAQSTPRLRLVPPSEFQPPAR